MCSLQSWPSPVDVAPPPGVASRHPEVAHEATGPRLPDRTSHHPRSALLARFEPGTTLPPHRHVGDELIFLVEGSNADESGVVATGCMNYRPNGCVHTVTTQNGATVLAFVWGRTEPV